MVSIALDNTLFIQAVLFLVLIYILNVLLYRPVLKVLQDRSQRLADLDGDALSAEKEIEEKLAEYRARIDEAKSEGNLLRADLKKEGVDEEAELLTAANKEAQASIDAARGRIAKEMESALESMAKVTKDMGKSICEKVVGRTA